MTRSGDHVDGSGLDLSCPTVATAPSIAVGDLAHVEHVLGGGDERVGSARHRDGAGVAGMPSNVRSPRTMPTIPMTMPSGAPALARTGPCSMCSSRKQAGRGRLWTKAVLPMQPRSSSRKATTAPVPTRSTASIPATTPSAPSNFPPFGTESRCEPVQTRGLAAPPDQVPVRRRPRRRARPRASSRPRARGRGPLLRPRRCTESRRWRRAPRADPARARAHHPAPRAGPPVDKSSHIRHEVHVLRGQFRQARAGPVWGQSPLKPLNQGLTLQICYGIASLRCVDWRFSVRWCPSSDRGSSRSPGSSGDSACSATRAAPATAGSTRPARLSGRS